MIKLIMLVLFSGCSLCVLQNPLDGKAANWCEYGKLAKKACKKKGGVKDFWYRKAECNNGDIVPF